jgi:hypothetical protein
MGQGYESGCHSKYTHQMHSSACAGEFVMEEPASRPRRKRNYNRFIPVF